MDMVAAVLIFIWIGSSGGKYQVVLMQNMDECQKELATIRENESQTAHSLYLKCDSLDAAVSIPARRGT